ncbi:MAG: stage V sporulation protein SpoVM [Oscillospiraceae bacterium]|nr:stage V sporulation protein SpoVM [Oscillospiraceae bacterium]MBQ2791544.1 stage V sporulation protein SpoVM [Oscillospiraceae bacterium]MBQ3241653.1 stage V sporulation protein SpoVM [Oscillospiraceae bacterium]MBQ7082252.1 stage V sporulation protein SpoVM [Oscillospiraceae bacterium]MBR2636699.1 stage V sporulation protein SpoVM [Oscillospiraceae bacterium]
MERTDGMKVVVVRCPKILSPLLRLVFQMKREEN